MRKPKEQEHRMLSKDIDRMTGVCQLCGDVPLVLYRKSYLCGEKIQKKKAAFFTDDRVMETGLTRAESKKLRKGRKCCICGVRKKLHIDHNHDTGKIRGVLCSQCNTGIGMLKESPAILGSAIQYLIATRF